MTDFASIGIQLDSRPVTEGTAALDKLAETSTRVEQKVGAMNGQMNDTATIMRKNAEASNTASDAARQFLAPLQREIDMFGMSRAEAERYNAAKANLSAATQRQAAALGAAIDAMQRDERAARDVAAAQDQATRAADQFLKKLNDQVAVLGMNAQQLQAYRAAQLGVSDAAAPLIARLGETGSGAHGAGKGMEALNFQTVGARRELLVLAHELSQGNYQKFGGSMMVLGEQTGAAGLLFSAAGLAALGLAAAVGGVAFAMIKGALEQRHMNDALVMTGNYAGLTSDSLNGLAHAAVAAGGSIGEAKKVATELAGSGKFTGDQIGYITEATVAWEHATGQSVKSIIKDFESLAVQTTGNNMRATEAISRATIKLDDQYHFLTESIYEQIRALEKEGDAKGASALATETFAKATHDRAEEIVHNLGTIARGWNGIKEAIGGAVDAMGNWGKKSTPASLAAGFSGQLSAFDNRMATDSPVGRNGVTQAQMDAARLKIVMQLTEAVDKLNQADAAGIAQSKATFAQSEAVHAASRIAADDVKLQRRGMTELQVALNQYADDVAKVKAANPGSALVTDDAIAAHVAAITKAHTANVKGNDDRAKTLQDALVLEQTSFERDKSIYDAREKMLSLYHSKFGTSDADFYAGREAARAEYVASEAIAFAKESALIKGYKPRNAEEIAANKEKYDALLKQHLEFVDKMRNAGGDDSATAAASAKKSYDDIVKATHDAGVAEIKRLDDAIAKQRAHNAEIGKTKEQIDLAKQAAVDLDTAQLQSDANFIRGAMEKSGFDDKAMAVYAIRLNDLDEEIKRRNILAGLLGDASVLDANAKAAAEAGKAWKHTANTIENDLTNAILDGGGRGWKKLARDMEFAFARMILSPILQPISAGIASMVNPMAPQAGGSAVGSATGSLFGSALGGASLFGAGGVAGSMAAGAGWLTGATTLGGSLTAAGSLAATGTLGGIASSLGMAVGALGPIALGIGAAVAIWKKFDTGGTEHTGGAASASSAGVSAIDSSPIGFHLPQRSAEADKMTAALAGGIVNILDSTALAFGKTAGYTAATAFADDSSKDGAWGALLINKLGEKVVNWQDTQTSRWAPKEFSDGAAGQAEYLAALSTSVRTALNGIGLPDWAKSMLDGLGAGAGIEDIAKVVDSINATQRALVIMGNSLTGFAQLGDKATSALIAASGGIDALAGNASAYYDNFYRDGEKSAGTVKQISDALAAVNIAMPATRDGYRAQVEAQMALGEAGAPAVATMLKWSGAFAQVVPQLEAAADAAKSAADILSERNDLQKQLDQLTMSSTQLLTKQRNALDASSRGLFDQIQAAQKLKDAQDAAKTSLGDTITKMKSFADATKAYGSGLVTGSLSTLTPEQQYAEMKRQLDKNIAAVKGGDTAAQGNFQPLATAFLTASQKINGSDSQYSSDFAGVLQTSDEMAKWAAGQVDVAQASLDALNAQVIGISDLNTTMQDVAQAVADLPAAFAAAPAVVMPAPVSYFSTLGTANTEALVAEVKALREEVKGLRADQQKQTGDTIGVAAQVQQDAAQTIVDGVGGAIARAASAASKSFELE